MSQRLGIYPSVLGVAPVRTYTEHLVELAREVDAETPVPTCGDWTFADLVWHLTEVQDFWTSILADRPAGPEEYTEPSRPGNEDLPDALAAANLSLIEQLSIARYDEQAWSWHPAQQSVDFTWRRQSHEALIHCFDGVLAAGTAPPSVDPKLSADGLDELFTVMAGGVPDWATYHPSDERVVVQPTDVDHIWPLEFGSFSGTSPRGTVYDNEPILASVDNEAHSLPTVRASALDLILWGWGRVDDDVLSAESDGKAAGRLRAVIGEIT